MPLCHITKGCLCKTGYIWGHDDRQKQQLLFIWWKHISFIYWVVSLFCLIPTASISFAEVAQGDSLQMLEERRNLPPTSFIYAATEKTKHNKKRKKPLALKKEQPEFHLNRVRNAGKGLGNSFEYGEQKVSPLLAHASTPTSSFFLWTPLMQYYLSSSISLSASWHTDHFPPSFKAVEANSSPAPPLCQPCRIMWDKASCWYQRFIYPNLWLIFAKGEGRLGGGGGEEGGKTNTPAPRLL